MINKQNRSEWITFGILRVVHANANVSILLNDNFSYYNLMIAVSHLKNNALLRDYSGTLELTKYGKEELTRLEKQFGMGNITKLVIPDFEYIIEQIDIDDVYLP